ncbi:developmentally-regulated protein [Acrasis kona]|uniref:Developmentally-regulated protein n=1 Tax=Acrasis kona TaxID=1008807 RepID=A0AAW2YLC2_9EUKA
MKRENEDSTENFKKLKVEDVRGELSDVFSFLEPTGLDSTTVNEESFWKEYYEKLLLLVNINAKLFNREERVDDYKNRIKTKVLPLLNKKEELLNKITTAAKEAGADQNITAGIRTRMEELIEVHIAFEISRRRPEDSPNAISRFDTEEYDVPDSYPQEFTDFLLCQFDLSILADTFTSNLNNLPTSGHLYISCNHIDEGTVYTPAMSMKSSSARYYKGNDFVEKQRGNDVGVGTGRASFDGGYITRAFDVLDLPPNEDVDYFSNLEECEGGIKEYVTEVIRGLRAMFTEGKGANTCPQMFSSAYYTQHYSDDRHRPTLLMYYSCGGDFLSRIYPDPTMFGTEDEVTLTYSGQP